MEIGLIQELEWAKATFQFNAIQFFIVELPQASACGNKHINTQIDFSIAM
jgi:hypothetical protein